MRMSIDFTNLNKVFLKDSYSLPEIEQKVESLGRRGYRWKSFMDGYKGYHQIQMHEDNKDKTSFYIEKGTFCYVKMLFGLRNTGATYQIMVDKVFE